MYVIRNQHIDLLNGFVPCVTDDIYAELSRINAIAPDADITAVVDDDDDSVTAEEMVSNVAELRERHPMIGIIVVSDLIKVYAPFADDVVDDADHLPHAIRSLKKAMQAAKPLFRCGMSLSEYGDLTWNGETHRLTPGQHAFMRTAMKSDKSSIQLYQVQDKMRDIDPDYCPTLNTIVSHVKNIRALFKTPCPFFIDIHDSYTVKSDKDPEESKNKAIKKDDEKPKRPKRIVISGTVEFLETRH